MKYRSVCVCDLRRQMSGASIKLSDDRDGIDSRCMSISDPTEAVKQLINRRQAAPRIMYQYITTAQKPTNHVNTVKSPFIILSTVRQLSARFDSCTVVRSVNSP